MKRIWMGTLCLAVGLMLAAGCGKKVSETIAEKAIEKAIKADAKKEGKDVDVKVDLGKGGMNISGTNEKGEKFDVKTGEGKMTMTTTGEKGTQTTKIEGNKDSFSMTTDEGSTKIASGAAAKIPDDFPKDVPLYAGAELLAIMSNAQEKSVNVQAKSNDPMDKVVAFYKKEIEAQGWAAPTVSEIPGPVCVFNTSKGERQLMVMLATSDGKTQISIQTVK